jgi:hypothetical protein
MPLPTLSEIKEKLSTMTVFEKIRYLESALDYFDNNDSEANIEIYQFCKLEYDSLIENEINIEFEKSKLSDLDSFKLVEYYETINTPASKQKLIYLKALLKLNAINESSINNDDNSVLNTLPEGYIYKDIEKLEKAIVEFEMKNNTLKNAISKNL